MNRADIYTLINNFAPPKLAEEWDCSGVVVENDNTEVNKIMLALTVTDDVVNQALKSNCDIIISHHSLFFVPLKYKDINIFCAHTNLDLTDGGTTDELIRILGLKSSEKNGFVRYVYLDKPVYVTDFGKKLAIVSPNLRIINNRNIKTIKKIGFCAGSGADFITTANSDNADAFVTGDLKFHTALESPLVVFDIGHFESEIPVLKVFERLLKGKAFNIVSPLPPRRRGPRGTHLFIRSSTFLLTYLIAKNSRTELIFADEKSPFIFI